MTKKLFMQAMIKFFLGVILVAILIFVPAGTLAFINGWILMSVLFIPMFIAGILMMFNNPELLSKRLQGKEKQKEQDMVVKLSGLMFIAGFVIAGLHVRFSWKQLPMSVSLTAMAAFLLSYMMYAEVLRENTYLSRTIEIQENHKVISTGLYGVVRHPMYSATVILFLSMPLILGSIWSFVIFLVYPLIIAKRIKHEEALLTKELEGYAQYQKKVKYKLIPFIW